MNRFDVIVVGAGPAGATAAALTAAAGLRTLIIERTRFPRDKVCGDCVNPDCWEIFAEIGITDRMAKLPAAALRWVDFVAISSHRIRFALPLRPRPETGLSRRVLDATLLERATELGAEVWFDEPVVAVEPAWSVSTRSRRAAGRFLVAADGRNSTVARLLRDFPKVWPERIAWQTHFAAVSTPHVTLELHPRGYLGLATVDQGRMNLCLVSRARDAAAFRRAASARFQLPENHRWSSIAPLSRPPIRSSRPRLLYAGDAGRVVEPFTGEGILYALRTGSLAARAILQAVRTGSQAETWYARHQDRLYQGRLWVNHLARQAVLHPQFASIALEALRFWPGPLRYLTKKVVPA
ncbi:MAG: FAD-dependent monooxygenase [Verrucomicrobia bacterium]|nr:FAD-dependent monooxygenase [Verrucomicrobiota bacterium]